MTTNFVGWISTLSRTHARPLAAVAVREGLTRVEAVDAAREPAIVGMRPKPTDMLAPTPSR